MPALPVEVKYVVTDAKGRYRYNRHVPLDCRDALGKRMWNLSLGREFASAVAKAVALRQEHDDLIARLRNPNAARQAAAEVLEMRVEKARQRTASRFAALEKSGAPDSAEDDTDAPASGEAVLGEMWRRVPNVLAEAEDEADPALRHRRLAGFMAMAFGDQTHGALSQRPDLPAPTGKTDAKLYASYRAMLHEALEEISPTPDTTPDEMRLSALVEAYIALEDGLRANTAKSYRNKTNRLIKFAGDMALPDYDSKTLKAYRDTLKASGTSPATIAQYFAALKIIWKWAATEHEELADLHFPHINLGKSGATVEETRWQAFDETDIKTVWRRVSAAWGSDSASKLSPSRRKAFLMAIRVMLYTGMRPAEVFRLKEQDVKDGILSITYTKTKSPRKLPLSMHIADFPDFLAAGGFEAELEAGRMAIVRGKVWGKPATPESLAKSLSDNFVKIIRPALPNDRHVLYSMKDTLIDRLQHLEVGDDLMRAVIGHVGGQGKLRHYKTPFDRTAKGLAVMRKALDAIVYW